MGGRRRAQSQNLDLAFRRLADDPFVRSVDVALDVRESGTAAQPVKSETFSDEWHVRVYSHAARSSSRSSLFEDGRLTTANSSQRSRRIGHLSRVFPPWDVLSSL